MSSYRQDRERFIVEMVKRGLDHGQVQVLLRCATGLNRLAELACSSEAADRDRIPCPETTGKGLCLCDGQAGEHLDIPRIRWQEYRTEERARAAVPEGWAIVTEGDPRGYTLRVIPPDYAARNFGRPEHDLESIGVPPGPSRIHW